MRALLGDIDKTKNNSSLFELRDNVQPRMGKEVVGIASLLEQRACPDPKRLFQPLSHQSIWLE